MAEKRGKCLVTVYAEVPAEIEEEYNRWYDTHHIPARLQVPGQGNHHWRFSGTAGNHVAHHDDRPGRVL